MSPIATVEPQTEATPAQSALRRLRDLFGVSFAAFDAETGRMLESAVDQPWLDSERWEPLVRVAAEQGGVDVIADEDALVVVVVPLPSAKGNSQVAVATFATTRQPTPGALLRAAELCECDPDSIATWLHRQPLWPVESLLRAAEGSRSLLDLENRSQRLQLEINELSKSRARTLEETSLLYSVTRNLRLSRTINDLGEMALGWLAECVPAQSLALLILPDGLGSAAEPTDESAYILTHGRELLDVAQFQALIRHLQMSDDETAVVANANVTSADDWPFDEIHELIIAPVTEGKRTFGYLAALNHANDDDDVDRDRQATSLIESWRMAESYGTFNREECDEFGSIEATLLGSVATLLGIHAGNHRLYRKQALMLENFVRALTSAIDAKDAYTRGHSDRVARISVRLAEHLGLDTDLLKTIYLAGVLHDIGKIGIEDSVLRKPDRLTESEFEHVKEHPEKGYRILEGIQEFNHILPAVRHHHEQWDGQGYPHGLKQTEIPLIARIVAVADSFDAMTSDRPYRKGMADDKVDSIFQAGAGRQWDADVVNALFALRDEIGEIVQRGNEQPCETASLDRAQIGQ